ncbi:hypothetical protein B0J11DRAFT_394481, partial [Dendryphion nanum]
PSPFYIVTTSQSAPARNSSALANVSATSLFNPFSADTLRLRLQSTPYGSLPNFTLTSSSQLSSTAYSARNRTYAAFHSVPVQPGGELQLLAAGFEEGEGGLKIKDGYLLGVEEETEGWSICPGDMGERVVRWKGGKDCEGVFLQVVRMPPY